ncbi:CBS domain-containing protein [Actinoalloteichus hymeniacidonis]|uniref:CBS domain-containing protein n=1 Tax=Actinoalloteichus hymeniacidonis TaxID=340345 RepID=A0AAC9HRQ2_9PSEU|nr:CBS domain-containing protein [Actinoalloteichus hymeniacidonis]AOS63275.1 CBS domain-containing protein [Actinoalloteichus hymeniacidonis]MBB5908686.1 CBS domain-containing protein [Actinoalloteichus hymeniacidonis]
MTAARHIMTPDPALLSAEDNLRAAAHRMQELGVDSMPICDSEGSLLAMLSERQIARHVLAGELDAEETNIGELRGGEPISILPDDSAEGLINIMIDNRLRRLPVLDGPRLIGMVSLASAAEAMPEDDIGLVIEALAIP